MIPRGVWATLASRELDILPELAPLDPGDERLESARGLWLESRVGEAARSRGFLNLQRRRVRNDGRPPSEVRAYGRATGKKAE